MSDNLNPKAILFDFYGTLIEISTNEHDIEPWRAVASFLRYHGANINGEELRGLYFRRVDSSLKDSIETYPDIDVIYIFRGILSDTGVAPCDDKLALTVATLLRSLTVKKFFLYPEALSVLNILAKKFRLGLVSDSQAPYLISELKMASLEGFFETVVISSREGIRKPDARLFELALSEMKIAREEAVYVGDSWTRDVVGALSAGIRPIWIRRNVNDEDNEPPTVTMITNLNGLLSL